MKNEKISIVFFGSGPVAAASLALLKQQFYIEAVVTKATTYREMQSVDEGLKVHTVSDKKDLDALFTTEKFDSSLGILIDFGIIVSNKIINYFEHRIINSHFSLLPELRGADPISFAILEGRQKTGVSLMVLVEAMDEGPIIKTEQYPLLGNETTPHLTESLVKLSYKLLTESISQYVDGELLPVEQEIIMAKHGLTTSYTRKLLKSDGLLDWTKSAEVLEREVRGYYDWPKSYTKFGDIDCIITSATVADSSGESGTLFISDKKLAVNCGQKALVIQKLKPAGKAEMDSQAFLAGYKDRIFS